jgi:branched-chain amino acid transport system permease protein
VARRNLLRGIEPIIVRARGFRGTWLQSLLVVAIALLAIYPLVTEDLYYMSIGTLAAIYVLLGVGMNILMGHAGLVHAGYAAFYGVGAYAVAILATKFDFSFWPAALIGMLGAAALSVLVGLPAIRVSGLYFVLVTLGFGEIFRLVVTNSDYTGGPNGLYGIPPPTVGDLAFDSIDRIYILSLALAGLALIVMARVATSRVGRAWNYVREDETAAATLGINPVLSKLQAALLGGFAAGAAGALFAVRQTAVAPSSFTFFESFIVILVVSIGGLRSLGGTVVGVLAMVVLPELLRPLQQYRFLIFGIAIVLMMLFRPVGLWPGRPGRRYQRVADDLVANNSENNRSDAR